MNDDRLKLEKILKQTDKLLSLSDLIVLRHNEKKFSKYLESISALDLNISYINLSDLSGRIMNTEADDYDVDNIDCGEADLCILKGDLIGLPYASSFSRQNISKFGINLRIIGTASTGLFDICQNLYQYKKLYAMRELAKRKNCVFRRGLPTSIEWGCILSNI